MKNTVRGKFQIKATPQAGDEALQTIGAMRMTFDKDFKGSLEATSVVSMIGLMNKELGSGAYVALERVVGKLEGRTGSFCLQHSSTMNRGTPTQKISVIPDTGSGELAGLSGEMAIDIVDGQHFYTFEYEL